MLSFRKRSAAVALANRKANQSLNDVAVEGGVTRKTLWEYLKDSEFREEVARLTDHILVTYMPAVDEAMLEIALAKKAGAVPAARYLAERGGRTMTAVKDETFEKFRKKLDTADADSISFYMEHDRWPDDPEMMPEPEMEQ